MPPRPVNSPGRSRTRPRGPAGGDRTTDGGCRCSGEASSLLAAARAKRFGEISPSIYETARLVADASWLPGHRTRIEYLLAAQHPDGGWGGPDAYALVPTLSATEALLSTVLRPPARLPAALLARSMTAVDVGLSFAHRLLRSTRAADLPDTPAIEVIVPFLVARLQGHLDELRCASMSGLDRWRARVRLPLPTGLTAQALRALHDHLRGGGPVPLKALHSLEVAGELAVGLRGIPRPEGTVGASPAATAAWLGTPARDPAGTATGYLRSVIAQHGGPVPSVVPITNFERAWVVTSLALGGLPITAPRGVAAGMLAALRPRGVAGGVGLPPDADTTSATLTALRQLGLPVRDGVLRGYDQGSHFCTWPGERTASPTTNAHVLTALATHDGRRRSAWRMSAIDRIATWLRENQQPEGFWADKWHASPYYATACAVVALRDAAGSAVTAASAATVDNVAKVADAAVGRAVDWVLATQRRDGSWGRWAGTAEETAYALQILLYRATPDRRARAAAVRGYRFLVKAETRPAPPLWHDKDLYTPGHVVRAAVVGARHLAETVLGRSS